MVYFHKGDYDKAIEFHNKSLTIRLKVLGSQHPHVAQSYNNLGIVYFHKGEYDKAMELYNKSLSIWLKVLGTEHLNVAFSYSNLGCVYDSKGEYEKAIEFNNKSLSIRLKVLGSEHPDVATSYNNLGMVYFHKGEYDKAMELYNKSLSIWLKVLGAEHPYVAQIYSNFGKLYEKQKKYKQALEYYIKALDIVKNKYQNLEIKIREKISDVYEAQDDSDSSIYQLNKAIEIVLKYRFDKERGKVSLMEQNDHLFRKLFNRYIKNDELENAYETSEKMKGLSITENMNLREILEKGKVPKKEAEELLSMKKRMVSLNTQAIVAQVQGEKGSKRSDKIWQEMNELENIIDKKDKELEEKYTLYNERKNPEISKIKDIKKTLRKLNRENKKKKTIIEYFIISDENERENVHAFIITKKGFEHKNLGEKPELKQKVDTLRMVISSYPEWRDSFIMIKTPEGKKILCEIEECYKADIGSKIYKKVIVEEQKGDIALKTNTQKFKNVLLGTKINDDVSHEEVNSIMEHMQKEIYEELIKSLEEEFDGESIVIVPDSYLYTIPFTALKDKKGNYLIQNYNISVIHSATVWNNVIASKKKNYHNELLAFGHPVYNQGHSDTRGAKGKRGIKGFRKRASNMRISKGVKFEEISNRMNNLPGSLEEVKEIETMAFKKPNLEHVYLGVRANKDEIFRLQKKGKLEDYRIVHFSVHGLFFGDAPELNSLALTSRKKAEQYRKETLLEYEKQNGKIERDGFLKQGEIMELGIKSELVVMSACETSLGTARAGEGMVGLPQAFLIGGSRNVLATLWSVDDKGTMEFFKVFYPKILNGKEQASSVLRETQLEIINQKGKYSDPFYWSPFVMYGE